MGVDEKTTTAFLNTGQEDAFRVRGYKLVLWRRVIIWFLFLVSAGFLRLIYFWKPTWWVKTAGVVCSLEEAHVVLIKDSNHQTSVQPIITADIKNPSSYRKYQLSDGPDSAVDRSIGKSLSDFSYFVCGGNEIRSSFFRFFKYQKLKYIWNSVEARFEKLLCLDNSIRCSRLYQLVEDASLNWQVVADRRPPYGPNLILVRLKSIPELLFREVLNPFYVFQIFSIILWCTDDYWKYAICIGVISLMSVATDVYQIDQNQRQLRSMVHSSAEVSVYRREDRQKLELVQLSSASLVPGDIIQIPASGCVMYCDAVVLNGNVIVNESMLTGESVPVTKTPLPSEFVSTEHHGEDTSPYYDDKEHARHTLFSGTHVLQARFYAGKPVRALVVRTGFYTAKGALVRSIMYPKPVDYHFTKDLFKMIGLLGVIALCGFVYSLVIMLKRGVIPKEVVLRSLDIVTIVVPPALPLAMTVGIMIARSHLKRQKIFCIAPSVINTCGEVNAVVFDKTGTLTEDGLDFQCVLAVDRTCTNLSSKHTVNPVLSRPAEDIYSVPFGLIHQAMAACHSLTYLNGQLAGDPLDLIIFLETGWLLEEPQVDETAQYDQIFPTVVKPDPDNSIKYHVVSTSPLIEDLEIGILKQFPFSSSLQRMSVLAKRMGRAAPSDLSLGSVARTSNYVVDDSMLNIDLGFIVFCKGAPEMIASLCLPASIPSDFHQTLHSYTQNGLRVIALSYRMLDIPFHKALKVSRSSVESDLNFLGLVVLENRLKPESIPVIQQLQAAHIRPIMATGDNIQTALSVAKECHILRSNAQVYLVDHDLESDGLVRFSVHKIEDSLVDNSESTVSGGETSPKWSSSVSADASETVVISPDESSIGFFEAGSDSDQVGIIQRHQSSSKSDREDSRNMKRQNRPGTKNKTLSSSSHDLRYQLALTGKTFKLIHERCPEVIPRLVTCSMVFARMSPDQKATLVGNLQELGYVVAMCGDGANDCGALKAAHAGISLSEAEASIASPFTSKTPNISCVPTVIREGRAALVTSFGEFKYMASYSLCQFFSVSILYWLATNLADYQFLYIDLFLITTNAAVFGYTDAADRLARRPPPSRVFSLPTIVSIFLIFIIQAGFQIFIFIFVTRQPWFFPFMAPPEADDFDSYQVTAVFLVSSYQYMAMILVHSKAAPHRKTIISNPLLTIVMTFTTAVTVYITIAPPAFLSSLLSLKMPPDMLFRIFILILAILNVSVCVLVEWVVVDWLLLEVCRNRALCGMRHDAVTKEHSSIATALVADGASVGWLVLALNGHRQRDSPVVFEVEGDRSTPDPGGYVNNGFRL